MKQAAVESITDQQLLYQLVVSDDKRAAMYAVKQLSDQELLKKAALSTSKNAPFDDIIMNITDADAFKDIYANAASSSTRREALERVEDPEFLLTVMTSAPDAHDRSVARDTLSSDFISDVRFDKELSLTEEQRNRFVNGLITETNDSYDVEIPGELSEAELQRIFSEAALDSVKGEAAFRLAQYTLADKLPDFYKKVYPKYSDPHWQECVDRIERRVDKEENENIDLLMRFILDAEIDCNMASRCIRLLFKDRLDDKENIDQYRDRSVKAFFANMDHYIKNEGRDEEYCVIQIASAISPDQHEKYGFKVEKHQYESEDQYGRYQSGYEVIEYKGKRYTFK